MDLRFYLFSFALYLVYENRGFLEILKGKQTEQLAIEHEKSLTESAEEMAVSSHYFEEKTLRSIGIFVMVFELLVEISYFTMATYFFRNPIFLGFTVICTVWWLWELPGLASRFLAVIRDVKNVQELEICRGVRMWLREAVFSAHAIILMVMLASSYLFI